MYLTYCLLVTRIERGGFILKTRKSPSQKRNFWRSRKLNVIIWSFAPTPILEKLYKPSLQSKGTPYFTHNQQNTLIIMFALRTAASRTAVRSNVTRRFASTEADTPKGNNTALLVALGAAAVGGAYYYTKTDKGRAQAKEAQAKVEGKIDEGKGQIDAAKAKVEGKVDEVKGKAQGKVDEVKGKAQGTYESLKGKAEGKVDEAKGEYDATKAKAEGKAGELKAEAEKQADNLKK